MRRPANSACLAGFLPDGKRGQVKVLTLKEGENALHFSRINPPQAGIAVKSFTLKPRK